MFKVVALSFACRQLNEQAVVRAAPCFVALSFGIVYGQRATTVISRD